MIGIRCYLRFKTTDSKKTLGSVFKKMNTDTKQLFGNLLETNKLRKTRLKIVDKGRVDEMKKENKCLDELKSKIKPLIKGKTHC